MKQLDLGCGGSMRLYPGVEEKDYYGIDVEPTSPNVKKADLVVEPIPFEDDEFDVVTAHDFMEHVPPLLYNFSSFNDGVEGNRGAQRRSPLIELFNEIYRVLKHDGIFHMQSPAFPSNGSVSDPGHVSYWTEESANYYSGDYFGWHDHYGHTSRFARVESFKDERDRIQITFRAIKNLPSDHPYQLSYEQ